MTDARATFYFDFVSPYAYLAAERVSGPGALLLTLVWCRRPESNRHGFYPAGF